MSSASIKKSIRFVNFNTPGSSLSKKVWVDYQMLISLDTKCASFYTSFPSVRIFQCFQVLLAPCIFLVWDFIEMKLARKSVLNILNNDVYVTKFLKKYWIISQREEVSELMELFVLFLIYYMIYLRSKNISKLQSE